MAFRDPARSATAAEPPERSSRQVWALGARILAIQVATMILLWVLEARFAGG
jgi:hypothetical protein